MRKIIGVLAEGAAWSAFAIAILWFMLPNDQGVRDGFFRNDFARRWDGGCAGWTPSLATIHGLGDLLIWTDYVIIAIVIRRLHPIVRKIKTAWITVSLIVLVFVTCGATHLFEAYTIFDPVYVATGWFKVITAIVGLFGSVFIAHNLIITFDEHAKDRARLKVLEAKLKKET